MSKCPTLETARLRLRAHRVEDWDDATRMWADPQVTRFTIGRASTAQETWSRLLRYAGHWELLGYGYWAVEEKSTGVFAGELGYADFKRELTPSIEGIPELGWALVPAMHGKGYATEALRAVLEWGARHLASDRAVCIIDPENAVSIRVAEKVGFVRAREATCGGNPTLLFERMFGV